MSWEKNKNIMPNVSSIRAEQTTKDQVSLIYCVSQKVDP